MYVLHTGIPAAPVDAPEDPFAGGININPGNFSRNFSGNASNHRKQANVVYATEHLYELRLIVKFLVWIKENGVAAKALIGGRSNVICLLLLNKLWYS